MMKVTLFHCLNILNDKHLKTLFGITYLEGVGSDHDLIIERYIKMM